MNAKVLIAVITFISIGLSPAGAQITHDQLRSGSDEQLLREWIMELSHDDFGGRKPMTPYEDKTVGYLARQLETIGLEPNKYPMPVWYHKPCDEYHDDWDLSGTLYNVNLIFSVALSLSNNPR